MPEFPPTGPAVSLDLSVGDFFIFQKIVHRPGRYLISQTGLLPRPPKTLRNINVWRRSAKGGEKVGKNEAPGAKDVLRNVDRGIGIAMPIPASRILDFLGSEPGCGRILKAWVGRTVATGVPPPTPQNPKEYQRVEEDGEKRGKGGQK